MDKQCRGVNAAGERCDAKPVRPSGWCWFHDPELEAERAAGRRRGGQGRSARARLRKHLPTEVMSMSELQGLLCSVLRDVIEGKTEPNIGNCAAGLGRAIAAVAQAGELEQRIAALEAAARLGGKRA